jgi:hypothetical protein
MATITAQKISEAGDNDITFAAVEATGDQVINTGKVWLWLKNSEATTITITITAQDTDPVVNGYGTLTKENATILLDGADTEGLIGPFPQFAFSDDSGYIQITYTSSGEGITLAALYYA